MGPDHLPFLNAIRADWDADLPRLAYADFLEECGEADRAEFIRAQCESAGMPDWHPDRPRLEMREYALLLENASAWARPRHPHYRAVKPGPDWDFRRSGGSSPAAADFTAATSSAECT